LRAGAIVLEGYLSAISDFIVAAKIISSASHADGIATEYVYPVRCSGKRLEKTFGNHYEFGILL
jgi:hypothetical protein